ncbi:MAG: hypothetical protein IT530_16145 [Burkholderiales bacterium]|nr:hypothetical protein [Burkholderiales bacterium]
MKENVHPLHADVPGLADPLTGWQLIAAWIVAACLTMFLLVGAWTVGGRAVNAFVTIVEPTVTTPNTCER